MAALLERLGRVPGYTDRTGVFHVAKAFSCDQWDAEHRSGGAAGVAAPSGLRARIQAVNKGAAAGSDKKPAAAPATPAKSGGDSGTATAGAAKGGELSLQEHMRRHGAASTDFMRAHKAHQAALDAYQGNPTPENSKAVWATKRARDAAGSAMNDAHGALMERMHMGSSTSSAK